MHYPSAYRRIHKREPFLRLDYILMPAFILFVLLALISFIQSQKEPYYDYNLNLVVTPVLVSILLFGLPLMLLLYKRIPLSKVGLVYPESRGLLMTVPFGCLISVLFLLFTYRIAHWFPCLYPILIPSKTVVAAEAFLSGDPVFWVSLVIFVVLVPFIEEFFFRGIVYTYIRNRRGMISSTILCTLFFAFVHSYLSFYIWYVFVVYISVVLCLVYEKTRSVLYCTIIHGSLNASALIFKIDQMGSFLLIEPILFSILVAMVPIYYMIINRTETQ